MSKTKFYNLSTITSRIQQILQPHIEKLFWVKAEISSGRERGGTFYCDLVETNKNGKILAKIRCNIWNRDLDRIKKDFKKHDLELKLDDGTSVGLQCSLQYHPTYGLSLNAIDADPAFALGELELKKKEILNRLIKEGLLEPQKNLFTPMLPQRIGLITSQGSAAYNDFIKTLNSSDFGFKIYLTDCVVQGDRTEQMILKALEKLERIKIDLVVIIRGGGSKTELFSLDNEAIAREIAAYKLPVWTGIGHEIDISILDHVANRYFKTPTAVAEEIVARYTEMKRRLDEAKNRFSSTWSYRLEMDKRWLSEAKTGLLQGVRKLIDATRNVLTKNANALSLKVSNRVFNEKSNLSIAKKMITTIPSKIVSQAKVKNQDTLQKIKNACQRYFAEKQRILSQSKIRFSIDRFIQRINNEKTKLDSKFAVIRVSDPKTSLNRGFSIVYKENGEILKSVLNINIDEILNTEIKDGQIKSIVQQIKESK